MTTLVIHPEGDPAATTLHTTDPAEITAALAARGVRYERWTAGVALDPGAGQDEVLAAYASDVDRLRAEGYDTVDVARLVPNFSDP
ncbi:MAG TPA: cupin, partial [Ilumatobacteraceae bacterium]|nr:cupin [Ilumatobacteraceae bacterium]